MVRSESRQQSRQTNRPSRSTIPPKVIYLDWSSRSAWCLWRISTYCRWNRRQENSDRSLMVVESVGPRIDSHHILKYGPVGYVQWQFTPPFCQRRNQRPCTPIINILLRVYKILLDNYDATWRVVTTNIFNEYSSGPGHAKVEHPL